MLAEPLIECLECHRPKLIKLIGSGAAVIVRGTKNPCRDTSSRAKKMSRKKLDKLGEGKNKSKMPFWRDGPINKDILKNPEQYIKKGKID